MKNVLKRISLYFIALPLVFAACSSDDSNSSTDDDNNNPESHIVEYRITVDEPVITRISYRNASGNIVNAPETLTGLTAWAKPVSDVDAPFNAKLEMEFESPVGSPVDYTMGIYVDGVLKHSSNGAASGSADIDLEYQFN
ncbi:MAG: hypothetical protein EOO45_11390 [Flavobacterium sp.]|nr:MAG: hypothetical protein EOO45_11390 [Flavobacterium sp.]